MDTNICVNKVFTDVRNNKQFRLLWIDPQGSESYVFWLHEKTGVPSSIRINEIEEGLEKGWLFPFFPSSLSQNHMDKILQVIFASR